MPSDTTYTLDIPEFLRRDRRDPFPYDNKPISQWPVIPVPTAQRAPAWHLTPDAARPIERRPLSGMARDTAAFQLVKAIKDGHNTFGKLRKHCAALVPALTDAQIRSAIRRALYLHKVELRGRTYSVI